MMKIKQLIAICTLLMITPTSALAVGEVTNYRLKNGLEIIVIEDHRMPIVTHMLWYYVGAADEKAGKSGIAHFLEHLMFKGTTNMAAGEFSEIIAANGGDENAFTSYDYTAYFQNVAADRLGLMMEKESDRMQNLQLTENEVQTERDVILEERNLRIDSNPDGLFHEHITSLRYKNHPYGRPIIGWRHEIENLTRQDALDFYKTYYAPNNAVLIVAGDVKPNIVYEMAKYHYGMRVPSKTISKRIRPQEPPIRAPIHTIFSDQRIKQPYMIRYYPAPNRKTNNQTDAAAATLLAALLGGSQTTSYLGQRLITDEKIILNLSAWHRAISYDPDSFGIYILPSPDHTIEQAEHALDRAINDFLSNDIDPDHFARIKTKINAEQIYKLDDRKTLTNEYGRAIITGLSINDIQSWPTILNTITIEQVKAIAIEILDKDKSVTGWLIPQKDEAAK